MSNEYKDWERDTIEDQKQVIEKYPFLRARNIDGTIDTESKFPMMDLEIPDGWNELFYQMCDDIKPLIPNDFYFIQVKEKYNELVCYTNNTTPEVEAIIQKYRYISRYVCTICGCPASYETTGYLASLCEWCWKQEFGAYAVNKIEFKDTYEIASFRAGESCTELVSVEDEWNRYLKEDGYDTF